MNDVAADGIGVAQQVFGAFQVTHGQGGAQLGTGNAVAVFVGYVRNGFDLEAEALAGAPQQLDIAAALVAVAEILARSEEHTSELQSLMRISYAVFCLNTNNKQRGLGEGLHYRLNTTIYPS